MNYWTGDVRLEDAAGYWTIVPFDALHYSAKFGGYLLSGNVWGRFPFVRQQHRDAEGRDVYRATRPCISPINTDRALDALHCPDGWNPPV